MQVKSLAPIQHQSFDQPTILLVQHIGGDEDIPQVDSQQLLVLAETSFCTCTEQLCLHLYHARLKVVSPDVTLNKDVTTDAEHATEAARCNSNTHRTSTTGQQQLNHKRVAHTFLAFQESINQSII